MAPRRQAALAEVIKETAWRQIAEFGAPALSLRAVAREIGITAPAIYNYFPRRDDLVTALIIDAYTSFGDAQLRCCQAVTATDPAVRMTALGVAYRRWAIDHPQGYHLIFGASVPGYEPPMEQIMPAGARALSTLVGLMEELRVTGVLRVSELPEIGPGEEKAFAAWKAYGGAADITSLTTALIIWSRVHGLVSLELSGHVPPYGPGGDALYRYELAAIVRWLIEEQS